MKIPIQVETLVVVVDSYLKDTLNGNNVMIEQDYTIKGINFLHKA